MHNKLFYLLALLVISGCASQSPYHQANYSGYGYSDSAISDNHYRIHYKTKGNNRSKAMDFALLRAAEVTLLEGYEWFVVTDRQVINDNHHRTPESAIGVSQHRQMNTSCGLLTCTSTSQPTRDYSMELSLSDRANEVESIIEIRMGKGIRPTSENSYSAVEVRRNIKRDNGIGD